MSFNYEWKNGKGFSLTVSPDPYQERPLMVTVEVHRDLPGDNEEQIAEFEIPVMQWFDAQRVLADYLAAPDADMSGITEEQRRELMRMGGKSVPQSWLDEASERMDEVEAGRLFREKACQILAVRGAARGDMESLEDALARALYAEWEDGYRRGWNSRLLAEEAERQKAELDTHTEEESESK